MSVNYKNISKGLDELNIQLNQKYSREEIEFIVEILFKSQISLNATESKNEYEYIQDTLYRIEKEVIQAIKIGKKILGDKS